MKKILFSALLLLGWNVSVHAEELRAKAESVKENVESRKNDYVYDDAYGYAVPAGTNCQKYIDIIKTKGSRDQGIVRRACLTKSGTTARTPKISQKET